MVRPPWSKRQTQQASEEFAALREGVPDGLVRTLIQFLVPHFFIHDEFDGRWIPHEDLHNAFARVTDTYMPPDPERASRFLAENRDLLLDAVDFVLGAMRTDWQEHQQIVGALKVQLSQARSAYTVGRDGDDRWELQHRQPEEVSRIIADASSSGDHAARFLSRAWSKVYGRKPDYNAACMDAVSALEVVVRPVVLPKEPKSTLGKMIAAMSAKPSKWTTSSEADASVEKVVAMMELIWKGHYRHGDPDLPIDMTQEGAVMVVQLAAVLVGWFRAGYIRLL